jgi:hypothetical protein
MPRNTAATLSTLATALLAAGCGGTKSGPYSAAVVRAAFQAEGIALSTRDEPLTFRPRGRNRFDQAVGPPLPAPLSTAPASTARTPARPLTALLQGITAEIPLPSFHPPNPMTTLNGSTMTVLVFADSDDVEQRLPGLDDEATANKILGRLTFGFAHRGNVLVLYRLFQYEPGRLGFRGDRGAVTTFDRTYTRRVAAALERLE